MAFNPLSEILTVRRLSELADPGSFKRGRKYFEQDRVMGLSATADGFTATVVGSEHYRVRITLNEGKLSHECSCPVGYELCKHCVAATLAWLYPGAGTPTAEDPATSVRAWLEARPKEALIEMVFEQAMRDSTLFEQLALKAARSKAANNVDGVRRLITQATTTRGFVDYERSGPFVAGVMEAIEALQEFAQTDPAAALDLCEHAIKRVRQAIGNIDDSNGEFGMVIEIIEKMHLAACRNVKPDGEQLARKLFDLELNGEYGEFDDSLTTYADLLGKEGIAEFRRLAHEKWATVPAKTPEERPKRVHINLGVIERNAYPWRCQLERMMKSLAGNDFCALLDVLSRDLSAPHDFGQSVELCRGHKRFDDALQWARKGVAAFKDEFDPRLHDILAMELARAGKHEEAVQTSWSIYTHDPCLRAFQTLQTYAQALEDWPQWRDKAVGHIRKLMMDNKNEWEVASQRSLLVDIYLYEKDLDAALAESENGPCTQNTLQRLAETLAAPKPVEAARIYMHKLVSIILRHPSNESYREAVKTLNLAASLFKTAEGKAEFNACLADIRARHKAKRNLMKLLDQTAWP